MKMSEMFPRRYLRGQDVTAPLLATITGIDQAVVHPRPGQEEQKFILHFHRIDPTTNKPAALPGLVAGENGHATILNRSLAIAIATALHSDETNDWIGKRIVLEQSTTRTGSKTITARAPKTTPTTTQPATPAKTNSNADKDKLH